MIFGGMQRSSTIDFPGALACVLFTRGCDLDCFYCHNRELIAGDGGRLPAEEVFSFLEKRRGLLDGVVVSGGEPTLQPDLEAFLRRVRPLGYRIKLDTNGRRPALVERLWREGLLDYVAVDVKALPADYPAVCGADCFSDVRLTVDTLGALGAAFEARTTLFPGMDAGALGELLASFPPLPRWRLNYFHMPGGFRPADEARLRLPALTPQSVGEALPKLLAAQPNLLHGA